ncbi:AraC family transcriptional regulator [Amphibacillus sediminis]|uniref:AraC family transcriptional regulator n=1 Tax=Amphibacillus sediminis TaxID=360185 RepID=UPI0009F9DBC2|nr:GyrI-like domain-containing protein [Amphibacillus sediminis]
MDFLTAFNHAIDYIEEHLQDKIDYHQAARRAGCAEHHFKRMFSSIAGISLSEYIRRRRMSLAAFEITHRESRIIDISLKFGYQSPDAFSRAFQMVHGILPSAARKEGAKLKAYPRIRFQMAIKGDAELRYRMEEKASFEMVGIKERTTHTDKSFLTRLWEQGTDEIYAELAQLSDTLFPGVLHVTTDVTEETMDFMIAVQTSKENFPPKYANIVVPASTWAVFEVQEPDPEVMLQTWNRIYTEWFPIGEYEVLNLPEFVRCLEQEWEIWIPVQEKRRNNK